MPVEVSSQQLAAAISIQLTSSSTKRRYQSASAVKRYQVRVKLISSKRFAIEKNKFKIIKSKKFRENNKMKGK